MIGVWLTSGALIGLPLTPGWHACQRTGKGGFWPVEASRAQPSSHHNNCGPSQPILRPSVCFGLLQLAGVRPTDLLADPMCGVGSLPCEALHRFGCGYALCGDNNRAAVRDAHRRSRALGTLSAAPVLDVARWDVRCLPLRSDLVDVLIVDMPWGNRGKAAPHLVREALAEVARVLAPGGRAVVLLVRAVAASLERDGLLGGLRLVELLEVAVGGWPVAAVTLRKPAAALDGGVSSTSFALLAPPTPGPPLPSYEPLTSAACCAVDVSEALSPLNLAEVLVAVWPEVVPSLSAARRAVRHRRVALAADPLRVLWWRMAAPLGERLVLRPHRQRLQPRESLLALHTAAPLQVLWEDDDDGRWMVAVKPAGTGVLQGRRSLANALLALQASRYEGAGGGGDGGGGAGGDEQQPQPQPQQPWTAAYDGPMRVGGAWLVAKTPRAALSVLEQAVEITLHWVAIFRGAPPLETLDACGLANVSVKRDGRSVRYGAIREATFTTGHADLWREAAAAAGFPVVGDRPHCDGPTACLWIRAVRVEGRKSSLLLPTPERFARLFEREEAVCQRRDRGELNSEYALRMLAAREAEDGEVDDVGEEEGGEEEEDGEWGAGPERGGRSLMSVH